MADLRHIDEVILHAGLHKTGTSSIQKTFYNKDNNQLLKKAGVLYPRCWKQNHGTVLYSVFSDKPEKYLTAKYHKEFTEAEAEKHNQMNLEKLKKELHDSVNNHNITKLLLSGEQISKLSSKNLDRLKNYLHSLGLGHAAFKIIVYTRNPVTWAGSMMQQQLKGGSRYEQLIQKTIPSLFQERIGNITRVFDENATQVYAFESARNHESGIIGHLLEKSLIDRKMIDQIEELRANEGISKFTGEFLKYIHHKIPIRIEGKPNKERHRKDHKPLQNIRGDKFEPSLEEKNNIKSIARDDMTWLKEHFDIDYTIEDVADKESYKNIALSFDDVKEVYPRLTKVLRNTLVEFMENKLINDIPADSVEKCHNIIKELYAQEQHLLQQENTKLKKQVVQLQKEKQNIQRKFKNVLNSKSWKMTYPLRKTIEMVSNKRNK